MKKQKITVNAIPDIINKINEQKKSAAETISVIFITTRNYNYDWENIAVLHLDFLDVDAEIQRPGSINTNHLNQLKEFLPTIQKSDHIYVGCDRGIGRSPAVALFIAEYIDSTKDIQSIQDTYHFMNYTVYQYLKDHMN